MNQRFRVVNLGQGASLGQRDPCEEYKGGMDAFAKKIAAFNQQAKDALARGDNDAANQAADIARDAAKKWEYYRYLYNRCREGKAMWLALSFEMWSLTPKDCTIPPAPPGTPGTAE